MLGRLVAAGVMTVAVSVSPGWSCGFEDPNSAAIQRVGLNIVYPNALYVQGAVDQALRDGVLLPAHFTKRGDFFALERTSRNLRLFAGSLGVGATSDLPEFAMVLMGPVLWTRFMPDEDGVGMETHIAGPNPDKVVVVSDVAALAALIMGDVSGEYANQAGLVRYYGDPGDIERISSALADAFPGEPQSPG